MIDRYRFILLMTIILGMVAMGVCIALGKSTEMEGYGLREVMSVLAVVSGALCTFQGGPRVSETPKPATTEEVKTP